MTIFFIASMVAVGVLVFVYAAIAFAVALAQVTMK